MKALSDDQGEVNPKVTQRNLSVNKLQEEISHMKNTKNCKLLRSPNDKNGL